MLQIKHLTIKDLKNHSFIEDFSYSLGNEDKVGIIGEEGNGKSTLLKAIKQDKSIEEYTVISGTIDTDYKHIAYFAQKIEEKWMDQEIYEYLLKTEPEDQIEAEQYNLLANYETICPRLQLSGDFLQRNQLLSTLSGGEKVKLQLLKLMGSMMDLLLLDEPTNDLDIATLTWLEGFIQSLTIPVLFISHDETLLQRCATVILHLEQLNKKTKCKATIFKGTYEDYVAKRFASREKEVQLARKEKQEYVKKKIKLNDQMNAVHDALNDTVRIPKMAASLKKKMKNIKAQERRFEKEGYHQVDSIEEAITVQFEIAPLPNSKHILDTHFTTLAIANQVLLQPVDLLIKGREKVAFIGKNGCGKSLFLKRIYEELRNRQDIIIGYMPQNYMEELSSYASPVAFLLEEGDQMDVTRTRQLLGAMKFTTEEMLHAITDLSEGQKAKLFLLKFIKTKCNVILLDEPTRNLSPLSNPVIRGILKEFQGCIISISHDRCYLKEVMTTIYEIQEQALTLFDIETL